MHTGDRSSTDPENPLGEGLPSPALIPRAVIIAGEPLIGRPALSQGRRPDAQVAAARVLHVPGHGRHRGRAPALAAGGTQVPLSFNSAVLLAAGATASQSASHNACKTKGGATFGDAHAVNSAGWRPGSFTPAASPVAFTLGPATGKDAVCVSQSQSATIQVPAGKYTDAYFLVGVANGPALASITRTTAAVRAHRSRSSSMTGAP